jgi:hypothetical protein
MFFYAAVMIPACLFLLAVRTAPAYVQRRVAYLIAIIITAFAAARGYVGTDTYAYHRMFDNFSNETFGETLQYTEPLFVALIQLAAFVSDSSFAFVGMVALLQGIILVRLLKVSDKPADALAIYIALFFVNFEFNILRGGTAILLLLAARQVWRDRDGRWFYVFAITAVLAHYSAAIAVLPMIYIRENRPVVRLLVLLITIPAVFAAAYFLVSPGQYEKYSSYLTGVQNAEEVPYGLGFFVYLAMYLLLYLSVVNQRNVMPLTALFLFWITMRWTSNYILYIDRLELIVNALLLFWILEKKLGGWQRQAQGLALTCLVLLGLYGTLTGLEQTDNSTRGAHALDAESMAYVSPYVPYKFFWNE